MNTNNLHVIFDTYIKNFEFINNPENNETYKWRVVQMWQDTFDLEAEDLAGMLYRVWQGTMNLIDNSRIQPFHAIVSYAKEEPEVVREMFADLFTDDCGDLVARQHRIDAFIAKSEELRARYYPDAWPYENNQRSVMSYLFLNDPDHNYLYKSTQVHEFADCVEFMEDIGYGSGFSLEAFYRLCDAIVAGAREYPALMETHMSRFENAKDKLYPDPALHVLAFDIIYSSQVYGLLNGVTYTRPDSKARKLYIERSHKAKQLLADYEAVKAQSDALEKARDTILAAIKEGTRLTHKSYGEGVIKTVEGQNVVVAFDGIEGDKKFLFLPGLANGFFTINLKTVENVVAENAAIMKDALNIPGKLKSAEAAMQPYMEYL